MNWLDPRPFITRVGDGVFRRLTDSSVHVDTAREIFIRSKDWVLRGFLSEVVARIQTVVTGIEADQILNTAITIFRTATGAVVQNVVFEIIRCILLAIGQGDFAPVRIIWNDIFTNYVNMETLEFILEHKSDLAQFLIDFIEPAKLYATGISTDGTPNGQNPHRLYNDYNELNLSMAMNRHTVICQLQRLAKSVTRIFAMGGEGVPLGEFHMDTSLSSDFDNNGVVIVPPDLTITPEKGARNHGEQWLFVNGISGEYYWLWLYCKKLANIFRRDIRGIFNRSDGILWDLIECAGERDVAGEINIPGQQNPIIQRTPSSMDAQAQLKTELSAALQNEESKGYIVMIAYSQGCLLLRQVLQQFVENNLYQDAMQKRLRIFTFGNPSFDWRSMNAQRQTVHLCEHVNHTEHFGNRRDFVAMLGMLRTNEPIVLQGRGYLRNNSENNQSLLFISHGIDWIGHLFGAQYSLRPQEYQDGNNSKLLACADGTAMVP